MINLDDFSPFTQKIERKEEDPKKEIEKLKLEFQQKIIDLQRKCEAKITSEKEKAFNDGFKKGYSAAQEKLTAEFEKKLNHIILEKDAEFKKINEKVEKKLRKIELESKEVTKKLLSSILDNLSEVLNYLYISEANKPYLERTIKELIRSFEKEKFISVEAGRGLYEYLKEKGFAVRKDEKLGNCDFRLKFRDFEVESTLSEKLKNLREELEKEVKKLT